MYTWSAHHVYLVGGKESEVCLRVGDHVTLARAAVLQPEATKIFYSGANILFESCWIFTPGQE